MGQATVKKLSAKKRKEVESVLTKTLDYVKASPQNKLDKDMQMAVVAGANSQDTDLRNLAVNVAYQAIQPLVYPRIMKALDGRTSNEIEDMLQDMYLLVLETLPKYNGEYSLLTYYDKLSKSAILKAYSRGAGRQQSKHYQNAAIYVKMAKANLAEEGYDDPSAWEISEHCRLILGHPVPQKTVREVEAQNAIIMQLDDALDYHQAQRSTQPELVVLEKESIQDVRNTIKRLHPRYREYMLFALNFAEENGKTPTPADTYNHFKDVYNSAFTIEHAERLMKAATREFRNLSPKEKPKESALNYMSSKSAEVAYNLQTDEEDMVTSILEEATTASGSAGKGKAKIDYTYTANGNVRVVSIRTDKGKTKKKKG